MLLVALTAVVLLAKGISGSIEAAVAAVGAPIEVIGLLVALLVLLPETLAALRSARRNELQKSLNLALGSSLATIGLTIPAVSALAIVLDQPLELGIDLVDTVLMSILFHLDFIVDYRDRGASEDRRSGSARSRDASITLRGLREGLEPRLGESMRIAVAGSSVVGADHVSWPEASRFASKEASLRGELRPRGRPWRRIWGGGGAPRARTGRRRRRRLERCGSRPRGRGASRPWCRGPGLSPRLRALRRAFRRGERLERRGGSDHRALRGR